MMSRRFLVDKIWISLAFVAVAIAVIPLASILLEVTRLGISSMNVDFFTRLPPTLLPGSVGGLGNAVQGSLMLITLASSIGLPVGLFSGIFISEYGNNWYGRTVRFLGDVLVGNPSIVIGILGYFLLVLPYRGFSLVAGGIALGVMMIPIVSNTTAEALKIVPNSLREASHALGIRKWRTSILILANAKSAVATGALLALARVMGETAPLILTAGISSLWYSGPFQPVASLTYYIYYFGTSYPQGSAEYNLAWGAAFFLIVLVMGINLGVRIITRGRTGHA